MESNTVTEMPATLESEMKPILEESRETNASSNDLSSPLAPSVPAQESKESSSTPRSVDDSDASAGVAEEMKEVILESTIDEATASAPADAEEEMKEVPTDEIPDESTGASSATDATDELSERIAALKVEFPRGVSYHDSLTIIDTQQGAARVMYFYDEKTHSFQDLMRFTVGDREMLYMNGVIIPFYSFLHFESSQTVDDVTQVFTESCSVYMNLGRTSFINAMRYLGKYLSGSQHEEEEYAARLPYNILSVSLTGLSILVYFSLFMKGWISLLTS